MIRPIVRSVVYPVHSRYGSSGSSPWTPLLLGTKMLYGGKISELSATHMPNKVTDATDYIIVGGSAGSYTFQVPQTDAYKNADIDVDFIWISTDGTTWRTTTEVELIGYDFSKTFVKYLDASPYTFEEIWILKSGQTLTTDELNQMRDYCHLSVWWDNTLSNYGVWKQNRGTGRSVWPTTNPAVSTITIENAAPTRVVITHDLALDEGSVPATTAFALAGKTITSVEIVGVIVTLTVSVVYAYGDTPTLSYTKPGTNYLKATVGAGEVATYSGHAITNNVLAILVLLDTFTDANDTALASHTPEIGAVLSVVSGAWKITNNMLSETTSGGGTPTPYTATGDYGIADLDMSVNIVIHASGLFSQMYIFRQVDATHRWAVCHEDDNGALPYINLYKNGVFVAGTTYNAINEHSVTRTLRILCKGNNIKAYWSGSATPLVAIINITDAANNSGTIVGILKYVGGSYSENLIDSITVQTD